MGRGVLLDVARAKGSDWLEDGYAITSDDLDETMTAQEVEVRRGDYLLVRTGQMKAKLDAGSWDGYPGGDAPGLGFDTLDWLHAREVAAVATDTWGVEVRPNQTREATQPWHWVSIPNMGLTVGGDISPGRVGGRLRGRRSLRVHVRGAGAAGHGRGGIADESVGHQVAGPRTTPFVGSCDG